MVRHMVIHSNEKGNKKYYNEIMYIASNYYIFKKRPKTRVHSLLNLFIIYMILFIVLFVICLIFPPFLLFASMALVLFAMYVYLFFETRYRLNEYLKNDNSEIVVDEDGIESRYPGKVSAKLYWDSIEHIIINQNSISVLPYNFSSIIIFMEVHSKDELLKALKKYDKLSLVVDNSKK